MTSIARLRLGVSIVANNSHGFILLFWPFPPSRITFVMVTALIDKPSVSSLVMVATSSVIR